MVGKTEELLLPLAEAEAVPFASGWVWFWGEEEEFEAMLLTGKLIELSGLMLSWPSWPSWPSWLNWVRWLNCWLTLTFMLSWPMLAMLAMLAMLDMLRWLMPSCGVLLVLFAGAEALGPMLADAWRELNLGLSEGFAAADAVELLSPGSCREWRWKWVKSEVAARDI